MSLYLHQNGNQTGPFTEDQVQQMLQGGVVTLETLAWREGMAGWERLATFPSMQAAGATLPQPPRKGSVLGVISFGFSMASAVGWFVLLVAAGVAHNQGTATQGFNVIVGLFFMVGILLNFIGMVLGIIGAFQSTAKTFSILGASINAFLLISLFGLVCLGLAMGHSQAHRASVQVPQPTDTN